MRSALHFRAVVSTLASSSTSALLWICGLPRRVGTESAPPLGVVTRLFLVGIVLGTLAPIVDPEIFDLAWSPDDPFAGAGLSAFLSVFLHAGLAHAFGNAAFLLLFGAEVEHEVGSRRFALLLGLSELGGLLADGFLVGGDTPRVGASAALSGALVAYVVLFPWREIEMPTSWILPLALRGRYWLTLRGPWLLAIWLAHQFVGSLLEDGQGGVAYVAHLGGAVGGLVLGLRWRSGTG